MKRYIAVLLAAWMSAACSSGDLIAPPPGGFVPKVPTPPGRSGPTGAQANRAPIARADTFHVPPGEILVVTAPGILANDSDANGDPLAAYPDGATWVRMHDPTRPPTEIPPEELRRTLSGGVITGWDTFGGFTYTPFAGFVGTEEFLYRAHEDEAGGVASAVAKVVIVVE